MNRDSYYDIYEFIRATNEMSHSPFLLSLKRKGYTDTFESNIFGSIIENNSFLEKEIVEHIDKRYPTGKNMDTYFVIAGSALRNIQHELAVTYTNTYYRNESILKCIRNIEPLITFCRNEKLYGALVGYLNLYGKLLNILCGEDIY